jgi:hypothetical protein
MSELPRNVQVPSGELGLNPDDVLDELLKALADELDIVVADRSAGAQTATVTLWVQRAERRRARHAQTRTTAVRSHRGSTRSPDGP